MAGNPDNAAVWGGADVLIAPIGTAIPTGNAAFGAGWDTSVDAGCGGAADGSAVCGSPARASTRRRVRSTAPLAGPATMRPATAPS